MQTSTQTSTLMPAVVTENTTSTADTTRLYTATDLLEISSRGHDRYELVKGVLKVMSPAGSKHGRLAMLLGRQMDTYAEEHGLGYVFAAETGFVLETDPDTVRAPDVGFVCAERLPENLPDGYFPGTPDLAVEVVSPNDRAQDVQTKVQDWLAHGARLVWVVEPKSQTVTVYRPDSSAGVLKPGDTLDGEDLLPGFEFPVERLFR